MKLKTIYFLILFWGVLMFSSGCGTIIGKTVDSEINQEFNIDTYKRFNDCVVGDGFCIEPVVDVFRDKGLVFYNGQARKQDLKIYLDAAKGFCFPPRINPHLPFWLQFTFPRRASVIIKDAVTKKVLLEVKYKRALFATGAGYEECRNMIIEALKKALVESKKNKTNP